MHFAIIILISSIAAGVLVYNLFFTKKAIVKRKLRKAESKKITEFLEGDIAKVIGRVEFVGEPMISPLSSRECAYYHIIVEQKVSSGKSSNWKKICRVF